MIERTETPGARTRAAPVGSCRLAAAGVVLLGFFLAGCSGLDEIQNPIEHFDTDAEASRQDFREGLAARPPAEAEEPPPPIPELQPVISAPTLGVPEEARMVTVTVNETTPLKDVLIELAREARVDLELDPRIEGGVIFSAYERPFEEVMQRISDLADLRYTIHDNVVRIELDDPYHVNYRVGYLSIVRRATSEVSTASSVIGGDEDGATGGGGASSSTVSSESEANFWAELEANITQIMTNTGRFTGLVAPPAPVVAVPTAAAVGEAITALIAPAEAAAPPPPAVPAAPAAAPAGAAAIQTLQPAFAEASESFTINRQAGIVSVYGSQRQHRAIAKYLRKVRVSSSAQVLIEAKILEVSLDEQYRFGINWASLFQGRANFGALFNTATTLAVQAPPFSQLIAPPAGATTATANVLTVSAGGADLNAIANLVQQFGTVRALSSPRLTVMQNQTAVLKVAAERVFFNIVVTPGVISDAGLATEAIVTTELNTVTVGLVMTVQPSINIDTEEITLTLRPTITSIVNTVIDPAVLLQGVAGVESRIPELGIQEIDSVVTMPSGSVLIIGGLMQDRITVDEIGAPVLGEIPWLGQIFKSKQERIQKVELVILLRATITEGSMITPADAELYERFGGDRRPFPMQ